MPGILALFAILCLSAPAGAQDWSEYEYEPGEGLHEEEWYDPSDWFDTGAGVNIENDDWFNYGYGWDEEYGLFDEGTYGYGEEYYGVSPYYTEEGFGSDGYYTEEWYEENGVFEGW